MCAAKSVCLAEFGMSVFGTTGVACAAYGTVGVFGAAIFGNSTESNIMVNSLLTSPTATLVLYASLLVYLCCGMVTTHYALRASLDMLLCGPGAPFKWSRQVRKCCVKAVPTHSVGYVAIMQRDNCCPG